MRVRLAALAGICLLAAGCGGASGSGGGDPGGTVPQGASIAPESSAVFAYANTDFGSEQWQQAAGLFARFPGGKKLLAEAEKGLNGVTLKEIQEALGPESDAVYLDLKSSDDYVAMTKPSDPAKLQALLDKAAKPKPVTEQVDGWTVVADSQAQLTAFDTARKSGVLADSDAFTKAMKQLPPSALTKLYVAGGPVQQALSHALSSLPKGSGSYSTGTLGTLDSIAVAAVAKQDGLSVAGGVAGKPQDQPQTYSPSLPSVLPAGARLYVSFAHLDRPLARVLDQLKRSQPKLGQQLRLFGGLAGISVQGDLLPLLANEGAVAVYPAGPKAKIPAIAAVLKLSNEGQVRSELQRVVGLARLSGGIRVRTLTVGGVRVTSVTVQHLNLLIGVFDGVLVVTNSRTVIVGLHASGHKLASDPLYQQAAKNAGMPKQVLGFAYANLRDGLPTAFALARASGSNVSASVRANTKPLQSVLVWASSSGGDFPFGGFVTIK